MCGLASRVNFRSEAPVDGPGGQGHHPLAISGLTAVLGHIPGRGR